MHRRFARVATVTTGLLAAGTVLVTAPAHAATITCAPDPFEVDDLGTNVTATIAVGGTASRALCQTRTILPGKPLVVDVDYVAFTAVEGQAYTVTAESVGADLVNSSADRGGISVGFSKVNADGSVSGIPETQTGLNGDRSTSSALHAGRYLVGIADSDQQVYPEDNTLATRTIQGAGGAYTIRLVPSAPPPVLKSIKVWPNPVKAGDRATATLTFTGPILSGGASAPVSSSVPSAAAPGGNQNVPAGATTWTVPIDARRVGQDTTVTISSHVNEVGPTLSVPLTVRR